MSDESVNGWDASTRGVRMSDPKAETIFKYQMPVLEKFSMELPRGAEILRVASDNGMFWLWAKVNVAHEVEKRNFVAVKTGGDFPGIQGHTKYIGYCTVFIQMELALYIFEVINND